MTPASSHWSFYGTPTAFIGRAKQLHQMRESVRTAVETERRCTVLISGAPGIGKSRLLHEFTESLTEHVAQVRVVPVACRPDASPPYRIFLRMLRRRFQVPGSVPAEQLRDAIARGIVGILGAGSGDVSHFICQLVGLPFPNSRHIAAVGNDPAAIAERAIDGFSRMLAADARKTPLVIAIDNLHLARDESLDMLVQVASRVSGAPLVFLGASRVVDRPALKRFTTELRRVGHVLTLSELSDREGRRLLESLLARADELPDTFVRLTLEKAFGNPLSIEQIVQLQVERGAIEVRGDRWVVHAERLDDTRIPGTLRDVVRSKLDRLGELERSVLQKASVIGEVFWMGCLDVLRRADEGRNWDNSDQLWTSTARSDEVERVLESLRRRHIIMRLPQSTIGGSRAYTFKHSIERDVLYEGIEGPRRARYHRLTAMWLEARTQADEHRPVELIGRHWERGHHPTKATGYYIEAGERAFQQHMNTEAVGFFRRALSCLTDDDALQRLAVFHHLGRVHLMLGDFSEALGCFQQMLSLAWMLDDEDMGGIAYNNMGKAYRALGEYELALEHLKHSLVLFRRVEDIRGLASSADDIGRVHRLRGQLDLAEDRIREGLRLRRYLEDERSVAFSLHHLGNVHTERGALREAAQVLREALGIARKVHDQRTIADVLISTGAICYHRSQNEQALTVWSEALEIARDIGERAQQGKLLNNIGATLLRLDRLDEARETLRDAAHLLEALGDRRSLSDAQRNLAETFQRLSDHARALELAEEALATAVDVGALGLAGLAEQTLGKIYAGTLFDEGPDRSDRLQRAEHYFAAAENDLRQVGREVELAETLYEHGSFLAELARFDEARVCLESAQDLFTRLELSEARDRVARILRAL
jgi:tetratricopeptide (TPR) repeat protein